LWWDGALGEATERQVTQYQGTMPATVLEVKSLVGPTRGKAVVNTEKYLEETVNEHGPRGAFL
jgi:hypothetical protein